MVLLDSRRKLCSSCWQLASWACSDRTVASASEASAPPPGHRRAGRGVTGSAGKKDRRTMRTDLLQQRLHAGPCWFTDRPSGGANTGVNTRAAVCLGRRPPAASSTRHGACRRPHTPADLQLTDQQPCARHGCCSHKGVCTTHTRPGAPNGLSEDSRPESTSAHSRAFHARVPRPAAMADCVSALQAVVRTQGRPQSSATAPGALRLASRSSRFAHADDSLKKCVAVPWRPRPLASLARWSEHVALLPALLPPSPRSSCRQRSVVATAVVAQATAAAAGSATVRALDVMLPVRAAVACGCAPLPAADARPRRLCAGREGQHEERGGRHPGRWGRHAAVPADQAARQAGSAHWGRLPPHRRAHEQLHQQRHQQGVCADTGDPRPGPLLVPPGQEVPSPPQRRTDRLYLALAVQLHVAEPPHVPHIQLRDGHPLRRRWLRGGAGGRAWLEALRRTLWLTPPSPYPGAGRVADARHWGHRVVPGHRRRCAAVLVALCGRQEQGHRPRGHPFRCGHSPRAAEPSDAHTGAPPQATTCTAWTTWTLCRSTQTRGCVSCTQPPLAALSTHTHSTARRTSRSLRCPWTTPAPRTLAS